MGAEVVVAQTPDHALALCTPDPTALFERDGFLVIYDPGFEYDRGVVLAHLVREKRSPDAPFNTGAPTPALKAELDRLFEQTNRLFARLYPTYDAVEVRKSWRNMISGPEPMHFDSWATNGRGVVCSFMNVDDGPRKYRLSLTFRELMATRPDLKHAANTAPEGVVTLRQYIQKGVPTQDLDLPPGSIWFFFPKTIAHQLVHGRGAFAMSWTVLNSAVQQQEHWL